MNESSLKALLKLFALVADAADENALQLARNQVKGFLADKVPADRIDSFLRLFDEYVSSHGRKAQRSDLKSDRKKSSVNSVKVILLCEEINQNLNRQNKIIVMLRLLEFVHRGGQISFRESGFLNTLAEIFNLDEEVFLLMQHFAENELSNHPKLLHIRTTIVENLKVVIREGISGQMALLILQDVDVIFVRNSNCKQASINGKPLSHNTIYPMESGDALLVDDSEALYYNQLVKAFVSHQFGQNIQFRAENISYQFSPNEPALHPFSLTEEIGTMAGIMGASGSGKSTLLNVLNGNLLPASGKITINGIDLNEGNHLKQLTGYVPQDDLLLEELTVFENLWFSARLCLSDLNKSEIKQRIDHLLQQLDLEEIAHLKVGSTLNKLISGGQRKRVNIALELLREPSVLFIDEPTSGLSSHDAENVMQLLKNLALTGKLIFVVIHQPSLHTYKLLDSLLILDKGGYPVYHGHPMEAPRYFRKQAGNIDSESYQQLDPDEMLRILEARTVDEQGKITQTRVKNPEEWYELFKSNFKSTPAEQKSSSINFQGFRTAKALAQYGVFFKRNLLTKLRNRTYLFVALIEVPVLAFIIGYFTRFAVGTDLNPSEYIFFYNKNLPAFLFMTIVVAVFVGIQISAEEIIRDRKILKRESLLNLSWASYINSKLTYLLILSALQTLLLVWIGNFLLEIKGMNLMFSAVLFPVFIFSNLLGLNISAAFNSAVTIYILVPFLVVPQLLFSGVIVDFDTLLKPEDHNKKVPFIGELMASRWAYEAMAVAQFKHNAYECYFYQDEQIKSNSWYLFALHLPKLININERSLLLIGNDIEGESLEENLSTLKSEVLLLNQNENKPFLMTESLTTSGYNEQVSLKLSNWLKEGERIHRVIWEKADNRLENTRQHLIEKLGEDGKFLALKEANHNQKLEEQLRNRNDLNRIKLVNGQLIRKADYIFMPPQSNFGRAHFYAPYKQIGKFKIDTYWFNIAVLWTMNLLLYILLLARLPEKLHSIFTAKRF
jgi:ABC-type multidrug transport system ATPase subunit